MSCNHNCSLFALDLGETVYLKADWKQVANLCSFNERQRLRNPGKLLTD